MPVRVDVIFDLPADSPSYQPTLAAVAHAADEVDCEIEVQVMRTDMIGDDYFDMLPDGVVIGPGTPYRVPAAAEAVIRSAREQGLPLVGT